MRKPKNHSIRKVVPPYHSAGREHKPFAITPHTMIWDSIFSTIFILNYKGCCIHWWICIWIEVLGIKGDRVNKVNSLIVPLFKEKKKKTAQLLTNIKHCNSLTNHAFNKVNFSLTETRLSFSELQLEVDYRVSRQNRMPCFA